MTLDQARRFAMSLPEAVGEPHFEFWSFRVRGKIFATVPPDGKHLHVFVDDATTHAGSAAHGSVAPEGAEATGGEFEGLSRFLFTTC